jgi:Cu+-exporting ATPase
MANSISIPSHAQPTASNDKVDLPIEDMSCASCAQRVEKQLGSAPGVRRAGVNFATARATVEYDPGVIGIHDLMEQIRSTGYQAVGSAKAVFIVDDSARPSGSSEQLEEHLNHVPGIVRASFHLATRKVHVDYLAERIDLAAIRNAIHSFGYQVSDIPADAGVEAGSENAEYRTLLRKFWVATILSVPVLILAMGHDLFGLEFLDFQGSH